MRTISSVHIKNHIIRTKAKDRTKAPRTTTTKNLQLLKEQKMCACVYVCPQIASYPITQKLQKGIASIYFLKLLLIFF